MDVATLAGGVAAGAEAATCFLAEALDCKNNIYKATVEKKGGTYSFSLGRRRVLSRHDKLYKRSAMRTICNRKEQLTLGGLVKWIRKLSEMRLCCGQEPFYTQKVSSTSLNE